MTSLNRWSAKNTLSDLRWLEIVFSFPRLVLQSLCQIQFGLSYQCEIYHRNNWIITSYFFPENLLPWQPYNAFSCNPKIESYRVIKKSSQTFILNNYWMSLSMISWMIKTEVCVICRSRRLRQITQTRGFDNWWYHAKTEFNNCIIIHFSHNSSSETEAKRSAILFLRRTLQGA